MDIPPAGENIWYVFVYTNSLFLELSISPILRNVQLPLESNGKVSLSHCMIYVIMIYHVKNVLDVQFNNIKPHVYQILYSYPNNIYDVPKVACQPRSALSRYLFCTG